MYRRQYEGIRTAGKVPQATPSRELSGYLHATHPLFFPASPPHPPITAAANDLSLIVSAVPNLGGQPHAPTVPRERPTKLSSSDSKAIFILRQAEKMASVHRSARTFDPAVKTSLSPLKLRPPSSVRSEALGGAVLPPISPRVEAMTAEERQEGVSSLEGSSDVCSDEDSDEVGMGV